MRVTCPAPPAMWQELVKADRESLAFQTPAFQKAICLTDPYTDASRLYEFPGGRMLLLPMVSRGYGFNGFRFNASMPFGWGMGGLVGDGRLTPEEVAIVFDDLQHGAGIRTTIRPNPIFGREWASARPPGVTAVPRLAHVLDLEGGFDRIWSKKFASETRTSVRKAEKSGLAVECDTTGRLVPVFYQLYLRSLDRWAQMQHEPRWMARWRGRRRDPIRKFERMAQSLGRACKIWVAWWDGKPAASILVLQGMNASYTRGAMDIDYAGPTRANQLLHRLAIEEACQAGCRRYHMGESGSSSSLAQFKSRFGAVPVEYAEYFIERLPIRSFDQHLRSIVKRLIGFQDMQ